MNYSHESKRRFFDEGHTRPYSFRVRQLKALRQAIEEREDDIIAALNSDFQKPHLEAYASEIIFLYQEIDHSLKHLKRWMRSNTVNTSLMLQPATSEVRYEPLGLILLIAPWNYPIHLALAPLIGCIAAGNCAVVKPSEETPHSEKLLSEIISNTFEEDYISCIAGPGETTITPLIEKNRFDHIFFTGSPRVAKLVMGMAANHLTPVTLELGGKSPAIVDDTAKIEVAAKRITWSKFLNAGQTCVAPDYVMAHTSIKEELVEAIKETILQFYGADPQSSPDFARIVNERRFQALTEYLSGDIVCGGDLDSAERYIAPTVIDNVGPEHPAMREEIFGPILPILSWQEREEVTACVRNHRYPLACYIFSEDKELISHFSEGLEFGGGCINNCLLHLANPDLPFGGVGYSGMGRYHGFESFRTMSHCKSLLTSPTWIEHGLQYPPYSELKQRWLRWLMRETPLTKF